MSSYDEKVLTDTPMLDEIVYNCKYMINDGIVLKDSEEADENETESSMVRSDLYLASIDCFSTFQMYNYDENDIAIIPHLTSKEISEWSANKDLIPKEYRNIILKNKRSTYIEQYEEENEYYRELAGLPPYGTAGIYFEEAWIPESLKKHVDLSVPIHENDDDVIIALENSGVLDIIIGMYPEYKYLKYVGKRKMSIYECRKAEKFAPLYVPDCPISQLHNRFQELLELNRIIYLKYYYDEAYAYKSDYYDKFMIIMIILQTFNDMIGELPEYIIRKDVFDIRTIQYLFEASGVEFFPEIPIRYQISLVRNLNRLIKYKSSDTCIVDIVKLFGFDNIEVFKYYIMRNRKRDPITGKYKFDKIENAAGELIDDVSSNYELSFLQVGIGELADDAIKSQANIIGYDDVVASDQYWFGDKDEDTVRNSIMSYEFNMLRSKYMSIKSVYSMQQYSFQMSYFIGLLMNNNIDKSLLLFNVPSMDMSMNIMDAFIFMYALAHVYYGTEDVIDTQVDETLKILGFNFEVDMSELAEYLWEKGVTTPEQMGISGWKNPKDGIFSFNQLMNIYTKNKEIYDHVVRMMATANNKRIYDLYKKIYQSLMITRINLDYYVIDDEGTIASSYAEYLQYKNPQLYQKYKELKDTPDEKRNDSIATVIYNICCVIEEYIDMNKVPYLFSGLPAASIEAVKTYVMDIINFFKSFKVSILDLNTVYVFDNKAQCSVFIEDDWKLKCFFTKKLYFPYTDRLGGIKSSIISGDSMSPVDHYYISRIAQLENSIRYNIKDKIRRMHSTMYLRDYSGIKADGVSSLVHKHEQSEKVNIYEKKHTLSSITSKDIGGICKEVFSIRRIQESETFK